ncbi:unnamed protein product [Blepharisma stoltei]|uniref:Replication factor-A protein 1 N-terminal domain-containing protein n=1 Tax=Blepharisma stoltei TaxID=1481888 RepID=A0AAU9JK71_9CILI|nr:unnamed protein product [Blepharisma stoltei]
MFAPLSRNSISQIQGKEKLPLPLVFQIISVIPTSQNCTKLSISDGIDYLNALISNTRLQPASSSHSVTELSLIKIHDYALQNGNFENKNRQLLILLEIEFIQQLDFIVGNPKALPLAKVENEEIIDPKPSISSAVTAENTPYDCHNEENDQLFNINSFTILQCKQCKNVLTHSGYWFEGMVFSFMLNVTEGETGISNHNTMQKISCLCGADIGFKYIASERKLVDKYLIYDNSISRQNFPSFKEKTVTTHEVIVKSQEVGFLLETLGKEELAVKAFQDISRKFQARLEFVEEAVKKIEKGIARVYKKVFK